MYTCMYVMHAVVPASSGRDETRRDDRHFLGVGKVSISSGALSILCRMSAAIGPEGSMMACRRSGKKAVLMTGKKRATVALFAWSD